MRLKRERLTVRLGHWLPAHLLGLHNAIDKGAAKEGAAQAPNVAQKDGSRSALANDGLAGCRHSLSECLWRCSLLFD
jgi:hypothetical protein